MPAADLCQLQGPFLGVVPHTHTTLCSCRGHKLLCLHSESLDIPASFLGCPSNMFVFPEFKGHAKFFDRHPPSVEDPHPTRRSCTESLSPCSLSCLLLRCLHKQEIVEVTCQLATLLQVLMAPQDLLQPPPPTNTVGSETIFSCANEHYANDRTAPSV